MKKIIVISIVVVFFFISCWYFYRPVQLPHGTISERLLVYKSRHLLELYANGKLMKSYSIAIGKTPTGRKQVEGDLKTPEGKYFIFAKNPGSAYHKNLGISYPNEADKSLASALNKPPGSEIKIHGLKNGMSFIGKFHRLTDWTNGCIALTDQEVDEIYEATPVGTPIIIYP